MQPVNPLEIIISLVLLSLLVKMPLSPSSVHGYQNYYIKLYLHVCKICKAIVPAATVVGMSVDALPLSYDSASVESAHLSINT